MKTEKLYYENAYTRSFTAKVLSCEPEGDYWRCILDRSAFFPCEGGQSADDGTLGGRTVLDVEEHDGVLFHRLDGELPVGSEVCGEIRWEERFRKMQSHSAEHILSGIIHRRRGWENTGFHLADCGFTFDCGGELSADELAEIEQEANTAIWHNLPVKAWFPDPEELAAIPYRSKLELTENVRLVQIGDVDTCACCAPHVAQTGEIGMVKLTDAMRHRGGMRIWAKVGSDALSEFSSRLAAAGEVSRLLSVPQGDIAAGVSRLLEERDALKAQLSEAQNAILQAQIDALRPTDGNILLFADCDTDGLRRLCNAGAALAAGVCGSFAGQDGDYRFVIGSRSRSAAEFLNANKTALKARGGGKPEMVSGSSAASAAEIRSAFDLPEP